MDLIQLMILAHSPWLYSEESHPDKSRIILLMVDRKERGEETTENQKLTRYIPSYLLLSARKMPSFPLLSKTTQ